MKKNKSKITLLITCLSFCVSVSVLHAMDNKEENKSNAGIVKGPSLEELYGGGSGWLGSALSSAGWGSGNSGSRDSDNCSEKGINPGETADPDD